MEIAVASTQVKACIKLACDGHGDLYVDKREDPKLPFFALLTMATDNLEPLADLADVGLYVVCRRVIKPGTPKFIALFPMVHHAERTHAECDAHWRDKHAPLALVHHKHMTYYSQLSIVHTISGRAFDGFALCGFETMEDLRERFYSEPDSVQVITDDVMKFANPKGSPRRLIATPVHC